MKKIKSFLIAFLAFSFLAVPQLAFAAGDPSAQSLIDEVETELTGFAEPIINIVTIIMGIIGVVMIAINLSKYLKGDPSSNDSLLKVGIGMLIAVVLLQVIKMVFF